MVIIVLDCRASATSREKNKSSDSPWYYSIFILIYLYCIQGITLAKKKKKNRIRAKMTQVLTAEVYFLLYQNTYKKPLKNEYTSFT